jgi:hypothetical protein
MRASSCSCRVGVTQAEVDRRLVGRRRGGGGRGGGEAGGQRHSGDDTGETGGTVSENLSGYHDETPRSGKPWEQAQEMLREIGMR